MQSIITQKIKTLGFDIEHQSSLALKVRGHFKNHDVIISADHRKQTVTIASRSFRAIKTFSYSQFYLAYCQ